MAPHPLRKFFLAGLALAVLASGSMAQDTQTETIAFIRHGEKILPDIGQLNCQGLNRAMALPPVLKKKLGKADFIFAPGMADKIKTNGAEYSYVRPLITIAPTAIAQGLPINANYGFRHTDDLVRELEKEKYKNARIYVAWEHLMIDVIVQKLKSDFSGADTVPKWPESDYDSIFVVTLTTSGGRRTFHLKVIHENLKPARGCP